MGSLWSWLKTPPAVGDVLDLFGVTCLIIFGFGFVVSAFLGGSGVDFLNRNAILRNGIRHWSHVGLWLFGSGLFFFAIRALQVNPLSFGEPIWLVGNLIALLVAAVRCVNWWRTVYPRRLEESHSLPYSADGDAYLTEERLALHRARRS